LVPKDAKNIADPFSGTSAQSNEAIRDILSYGSSSTNSTLALSLMVE